MFKVPFALNKILLLGRCILDSSNPPAGQSLSQAPTAIACDQTGILYTRPASVGGSGGATAFSAPGIGVVASAVLPATPGKKWNALTLTATYGDTAAALPRQIVIRDGASGVGAVIWQAVIGPVLAGDSKTIVVPWPVGFGPVNSFNNIMTAEFTAAPAATGFESISIGGFISN